MLDLITSLDARGTAVVADGTFSILEIFDAARILSCCCLKESMRALVWINADGSWKRRKKCLASRNLE
jgi:hypothetical protein